jgi:hypothetical protein
MVRITVEKFAKRYVEGNQGEKIEDVKSRLKAALNEKKNGGKCQACGSPIWAIGSALGGFQGCFTCITGESDDSEDFEVE